jgi:hypothetical protein
METARVERMFRELNERIARANVAGSGWPSLEDTQSAQLQRTALNHRILAYNSAVAANEKDLARFNEAVRRYNLMMAYPDGLAEDRAKGRSTETSSSAPSPWAPALCALPDSS